MAAAVDLRKLRKMVLKIKEPVISGGAHNWVANMELWNCKPIEIPQRINKPILSANGESFLRSKSNPVPTGPKTPEINMVILTYLVNLMNTPFKIEVMVTAIIMGSKSTPDFQAVAPNMTWK